MTNINESLKTKPKSKRIFYFDLLRALAISFVILFHISHRTSPLILGSGAICEYHSFSWGLNLLMLSCCKVGVPLFLILSGALSLGRDWSIRPFLEKRLPRITFPFLFWGFVLSTIIALMVWNVPSIFPNSTLKGLNTILTGNLSGYINFVIGYYMANVYTSHPYWFFWMIFGIYLIMPVFNKWIFNSELTEVEYFLFFWLITCVFDFTLGFEFPIKLNYFISPMGLVVLGYYLRYTERSILNNQYFALFLMLFGFVANFILSYLYATPTEFYEFGQYSIFTTIAVIGLFLLFKNFSKFNINLNFISNPNGIFKKFTFLISKNSYGMYLCHSFILAMIYNLINIYFPASPYYYRVVVIFVLTVLLSCGIVELLGRIPGLDKIAGSK